jgi:hypothetical protein
MQLADGARLDTIPTRDKTLNNWQNGRKTLMKSMVGVTGFEPATYTSRT